MTIEAPPAAGAATPPISGAPGGPPPAAAPPTPPSAPTDWTSGLNDDFKGYVQTKGFKAPQDVLESYRNFEKLQGVPQERLLKLPENIDIATPEGRAIFEKLGAPKDAKEYAIDIPKEHGDQKLGDWFRDVAFKNGFTKKQTEGLVKAWNESRGGAIKTMSEALAAKSIQSEQALKTEWGQAYDQNTHVARSAVQALGVTKEQINAMEDSLGFDGTMKLLHKIGAATGEHSFITGGQGGKLMAPNQAQSRIKELSADGAFRARLMSGDAEAKREWDNLHKMGHQGNSSL